MSARMRSSDKTRIRIWNEQANQNQRNDVEQADSPEDLLHSCGKRLSGICCLSCCEANEFGAGESECCRNKDGA